MGSIAKRMSAALLLALQCGPALAAPGDKQFYTLDSHDPQAFYKAIRAGSDFVKSGHGHRFMIVLVNAGVIIAIPGTSTIQRDVYDILRTSPGVTVLACKETMDALQKANKRHVPTFPGITVKTCKGVRKELATGGWEPAPGL